MEEKFSVSLELMIQKFKDNAKKVQTVAQNVASKIKENMSVKPIFDIDITNVKLVESRMQELNQIVEESQEIIQYGIKNPAWASWNTETIQKAEKGLKNANAEIEYINSSLSTMNTNLDKNSKSSTFFSNSLKNIQNGMDKSLKKVKRFTLSLFGIQSGIRVVSRAMSAYSSIDEESTKKTQSAWIGLGSMFAWLKDMIADSVIKAVSYINIFVRAMTGVDFLAKAMKKSMDKANKSAGKLSKTLAGFDEITNLDDRASGATIDTSWIDAFKNVELDPKITAFFENLGKAMRPVYEGVMKVVEWFRELDVATQILIISLGTAGLLGLFFGTTGLIVGIGLLATGLYTYYKNTKDAKQETDNLKTAQEKLKEATDNLKNANRDLSDAISEYEDAVIRSKEANEKLIDAQNRTGISGKELYEKVQNGTITYWDMTDAQKEVYRLYLETIKKQDELAIATDKVNQLTDAQKEAIQKQAEAYKNTIDKLEIANSRLNESSEEFKANQKEIDNLKTKLKDLTGEDYSTSIEIIAKANTKQAEKDYSNFASNLGRLLGSIVNPFEWGNIGTNIKKLFGGGYADGLDYVPYEGLYHLHKGEKVVPAKFNSDEYLSRLGTNNSEETNRLLEELIDRVERIEINPYITITDIGQAAQKYRTQQSRIMGEELS
jgi:exonuclease VII small subunit